MNRVQIKFVQDAMANTRNLNEWEKGFISDLNKRINNRDTRSLTPRQNSILNDIQKKVR